jgi:hypothetical protein
LASPALSSLGGVVGNPLALGLLATPLRYYSPSFFRRTARLVYGPLAAAGDGDGELLQAQVKAARIAEFLAAESLPLDACCDRSRGRTAC